MATITIQLNVKNVNEVVKDRKGAIMTWLASKMKGEAYLKERVEELICEEVVTGLRAQMDRRFKEEGIAASLKISVTKD